MNEMQREFCREVYSIHEILEHIQLAQEYGWDSDDQANFLDYIRMR